MPRKHQWNFELRHLLYFAEVARSLHFHKASEKLAITQPALSRQIQSLEEALGVQLFERTRRRVVLTPEGELLARRCAELFAQLEQIIQEVRALHRGASGILRIQFSSLAMANILPKVLEQFTQKHPRIQLDLAEAGTMQQLEAIRAGEADCGFCHPEELPPDIEAVMVSSEPMGVVLPANHPLVRRKTIPPRLLAEEEFVLCLQKENPHLYKRMLRYWRSHGVEPRIRQELTTRMNRVALAAAGLGVTYACPSEAAVLPKETVFRKLSGKPFVIRTFLAWDRESTSPLVNSLVNAAKSAR